MRKSPSALILSGLVGAVFGIFLGVIGLQAASIGSQEELAVFSASYGRCQAATQVSKLGRLGLVRSLTEPPGLLS